jgi:GPH family glycoside/pentoside/hexuronide:cation symporter
MTQAKLPRTGLLTFAGGSLGMGIWVTVPGLLLLYFLTDILAVSPVLAGLVLLLPKIIDVLVHPWIGHLSDRGLLRRGHRRGLMLLGCGLPFAFAFTFALPGGLTGPPAALWVMVFFIAGNLLFALYQVPYLSTPADLAIGYHERTRLMGFRMVVLTLGILVSGVIAPIITGKEDPTRAGYVLMGAILGAAMLVVMLIGIRGVRQLNDAAPSASATGHTSGLKTLFATLKDRQFRWLVTAYLMMSTTTHLVLAAVPYYTEYELGRPGLTTVLVAAFVAPALLATPVWVIVARRIGKQTGLLISQITFALGSLVLAIGKPAGVPVLVAAVAILGICFAAMQLLPFSMMPDVIRAAGDNTKGGSYTGVWTAAEATGGAIGPYLYSACLAIGGFVATAAGAQVVQSAFAHDMIRLGFGLVPAALMIVAVLLQRGYTLDRELRA